MRRIIIILLMINSNSLLAQSSLDWIHDKQRGSEKEEIVLVPAINAKTELVVEAPEEETSKACLAQVLISYSQLDTTIKVETEIINSDCGASFGKYSLRIRTRNEAGETTTTNHTESWNREDTNAVNLVKNYSMNGDVDLASVRVRAAFNDLCTCKPKE